MEVLPERYYDDEHYWFRIEDYATEAEHPPLGRAYLCQLCTLEKGNRRSVQVT